MFKRITELYRRPLVRDTVKTTIWSTIGKAVGFLIPFFIAAWFGASEDTDAFFFAYGLILFLSGIFAPVVESVIVPYIAQARANNEDVGKFIGNILGISGAGLFVLTVLLILVIKPILSVITRFDEQTLELVHRLLIETAPLIIFLTWTSILAGTLNAYKKFTFPAISPAFRAIVNLTIIFTFKNSYGVHAIAFGYVTGEIIRLAGLLIATKRLGLFKMQLSFQLNHKLMEFIKTASYQSIGMAAVGLNPFVDKTMATWLGKGSVSILHYADRLYMIPVTFMTTGLMVTILSHWSDNYTKHGIERLKLDVKRSVVIVAIMAISTSIILISLHKPIISLVYGRKALDNQTLSLIGSVWTYYLIGLTPRIVSIIYARGLLILKRTSFFLKIAIVSLIFNTILNFILMQFYDVNGIAISTTMIDFMLLGCACKTFLSSSGLNKDNGVPVNIKSFNENKYTQT